MPNEGYTVRDIYRRLAKNEEKSAEFSAFLGALKDLDELLGKLNTPDKYGRLPAVNKDDYAKLQTLYAALGQTGETFLATKSPNKAQAKRLLTFASADLRALNAYDPEKEQKSIQDIVREGRTITLDVGEQKLSSVGGMISKRVPLSVNLTDGKKLEGVFTARDEETYMQRGERLFKQAIERTSDPAGKELLRNVLNSISVDNPVLDDVTRRKNYMAFLTRSVRQPEDPDAPEITNIDDMKIDGKRLATLLGKLANPPKKQGDVLKAIDKKQLDDLVNGLGEFLPKAYEYIEAGIAPDQRIDNRNAAMTTVAVLLGVPKLVCRSIPLKLRGADGKSVEGTIMDLAEGYDLENLPPEAEKIDYTSTRTDDMGWLKSVADLQVLDFICGNVDRHNGNMFYRFEGEPPKLKGVQGIDNDFDFGTIVPQNGKGQRRLIGTDSINAVSESMYNKVCSLTPEQLKFALRGHGLSEEELDAAGKRLEVMQQAMKEGFEHYQNNPYKMGNYIGIQSGKIRVVKDGEWRNVYQSHLEDTSEIEMNLFQKVRETVNQMKQKRQEQVLQKNLNDARGHLVKAEVVNRATEEGVLQERDRVSALASLLKKKGAWFNSGAHYDELRERLEEYRAYQASIAERLEKSRQKNEDDYVDDSDLESGQKYIRAIRDTAKQYFAEKEAQLAGKEPSGGVKARMDAVRTVLNFAEDSLGFTDLESETVEHNAREALAKEKLAAMNQGVPLSNGL